MLNEPERPHWSVSYDGMFRAVTDGGVIAFDEERDAASTEPAGSQADSLLSQFRALVQQYYTRIERKNYTAHD